MVLRMRLEGGKQFRELERRSDFTLETLMLVGARMFGLNAGVVQAVLWDDQTPKQLTKREAERLEDNDSLLLRLDIDAIAASAAMAVPVSEVLRSADTREQLLRKEILASIHQRVQSDSVSGLRYEILASLKQRTQELEHPRTDRMADEEGTLHDDPAVDPHATGKEMMFSEAKHEAEMAILAAKISRKRGTMHNAVDVQSNSTFPVVKEQPDDIQATRAYKRRWHVLVCKSYVLMWVRVYKWLMAVRTRRDWPRLVFKGLVWLWLRAHIWLHVAKRRIRPAYATLFMKYKKRSVAHRSTFDQIDCNNCGMDIAEFFRFAKDYKILGPLSISQVKDTFHRSAQHCKNTGVASRSMAIGGIAWRSHTAAILNLDGFCFAVGLCVTCAEAQLMERQQEIVDNATSHEIKQKCYQRLDQLIQSYRCGVRELDRVLKIDLLMELLMI